MARPADPVEGTEQDELDAENPFTSPARETGYRIGVRFEGQPSRLYPIGISAKAPHTAEFGPWQSQADGSEIRYRAKWPGKT